MRFIAIILCLTTAIFAENGIHKNVRPLGLRKFHNVLKAIDYERIVGGQESVPYSHPYQVGLFLLLEGDFETFAGGSLISRNYVLTVGHAISYDGVYTKLFTIVLGAHNIFDETDGIRYQSRTAFTHPGWDSSTLQNDIGVVKIPVPVQLNDKIQLINLPPYSAVGVTFEGYNSTVIGWGQTSDAVIEISPVLKEANVEVVSNEKCNASYIGMIRPTMICISTKGGNGGCNGDSGGPLITMYNGKQIEIGLVSFGIPYGCEIGYEEGFTRVTSFLDWIANMTDAVIEP